MGPKGSFKFEQDDSPCEHKNKAPLVGNLNGLIGLNLFIAKTSYPLYLAVDLPTRPKILD